MRKYKHVVVVGIDGAGSFIKEANTPCFDRIFANGAVTHTGLSCFPSISAECWGAMLLGVGPKEHRLTNEIIHRTPYALDAKYPTVFKRIREAYPEAVMGSYCDWNPITFGIVEGNLGVSHDTARDDELTPIICDYIREKKPDFLFTQLDSVDGAGHKYGYGTLEHLKRIEEVDVLLNDVYTAVEEAGMLGDTLFIAIADHGGTNPGDGSPGAHGGWSDGEKYVTIALTGKGVCQTTISEMNIRDLAAIVLYAFDIPAPEFAEDGWTSQIPEGIFLDESIPAYRNIRHITDVAFRVSKEQHTSQVTDAPVPQQEL